MTAPRARPASGTPGEPDARDRGTVLPLTMVVTVVLALVVLAVSDYVATSLRYTRVARAGIDLGAAADGGMRYAIEQLGAGGMPGCGSTPDPDGFGYAAPIGVNDATITVRCRSLDGPRSSEWGYVLTGEQLSPGNWLILAASSGGTREFLDAPIHLAWPQSVSAGTRIELVGADVWYRSDGCDQSAPSFGTDLSFVPASRGLRCTTSTWQDLVAAPPLSLPPETAIDPTPAYVGDCLVFQPGVYTTSPVLAEHNYFESGEYYFGANLRVLDATVTAGWADTSVGGDQQMVENAPCDQAMADDRADPAGNGPGATIYLGGSAWVDVDLEGRLEIMRRRQGDDFVSIQALDDSFGAVFAKSTRGATSEILDSSDDFPSELVVHGLVWAPRSMIGLARTPDVAFGQLLGGAVASRLRLHSTQGDTQVVSRREPVPGVRRYELVVTATDSTTSTVRATVAVDPEGTTAIESWLVDTD